MTHEYDPALGMAALWLLFGGSHIGLATHRVRAALVARFGELGFMWLFMAVASVGYALLVTYLATHRFEGAPGLSLGHDGWLRPILIGAITIGIVLITAGVWVYPRGPMALGTQTVRPPRGLERVTRHPFFAGVVLIGVAHVLLATRLVVAVAFGGFALLALFGGWHQDRKLLGSRGPSYRAYVDATSFLPFAAILTGRQRLAWAELPRVGLAAGLVAAWLLRQGHEAILADGGAWLVLATVGGAFALALQSARRAARRPPVSVAPEPPRPAPGAAHPPHR